MNDIAQAVRLLRQGHLVAFPTETVYGLGADATNPAAIEAIYRAKGRPSTNPLIIHVADIVMARRLVAAWPPEADAVAKKFWPGPLTLVLPKWKGPELPIAGCQLRAGETRSADSGLSTQDPGLLAQSAIRNPKSEIPYLATAGLSTVAIRVPSHPLALELLRAFGGPLAAPSANRSTRVSPTTAEHVREEFPDSRAAGAIAGEPSMILDGGPCHVGIESTVLDLSTSPPAILRPGHIRAKDLEPLIGPVQLRIGAAAVEQPASSPGQHPTHYAPRTPAYRFDTSQRGIIQPSDAGRPNGIIVLSPLVILEKGGPIIAMPGDPVQYAQHFYAVLRQLDAMELHAIYIETPPDRPEWAAIRDRILRATRGPVPA